MGLFVLLGFETLSPWDGTKIVLLTFTDDFEIIALVAIENYTILFLELFDPDLELFDPFWELTLLPSPFPACLLGLKGAAAVPRLVLGIS